MKHPMASVFECFDFFTTETFLLLRYVKLFTIFQGIFPASRINLNFDLIIFIQYLLNFKQCVDCFLEFILVIAILFLIILQYIFWWMFAL